MVYIPSKEINGMHVQMLNGEVFVYPLCYSFMLTVLCSFLHSVIKFRARYIDCYTVTLLSRFKDHLEEVLERSLAAGVHKVVVTGTSVENSQMALLLARSLPGVLYCTAGVHPHHAKVSMYREAIVSSYSAQLYSCTALCSIDVLKRLRNLWIGYVHTVGELYVT